jgi:hypothetical protein
MGFPSLTLNASIASQWRSILEANGFTVTRDVHEERRIAEIGSSDRIAEVPWLVRHAETELAVLEAAYRTSRDGRVFLVFITAGSSEEQQLTKRIQDLLVAVGATRGVQKEPKK